MAVTRYYDNFAAWVPDLDPVIHDGRALRVTSSGTLRENDAGGTWGRYGGARGARFVIPPAGTNGLTSRLAVLAHANDLGLEAWDPVPHDYTVTVSYEERGLVVGRD